MSHHSPNPEEFERFKKFMEEGGFPPLGKTNQFPEGKIAPSDEGEIRIAIGHEAGKVMIHFGKPVAWISFNKDQALMIAKSLTEHAKHCQ